MRYQYIKKDGGLKDKKVIKDLKTATALYEDGMIEESYDILENIVFELRMKFID